MIKLSKVIKSILSLNFKFMDMIEPMTPRLIQNINRHNRAKKINNNLTNVGHVKGSGTLAFFLIKFHMLSKQLFFLACNFFLLEGLWFVEGPLTYWEIPQQPSWHGSFTSYHHDCSAGYRTRRIFWGASWGSGTDSHGVYKNIINNEAQNFTLVPRAMARLCGQQPPLAQLAISRLGRWALQMGSSLPLHTVRSMAPFMHWMWKQAEFCRSTNSIQRCIRRWQLCVSTRRHWTCSTWFCKSW